ncbi:MAG: dihydroorotase [Pseudomonadales bacterium]
MPRTHIVNARMVNEGRIFEGDLVIDGERIASINGPAPADAVIVDLAGAWLLPGMIDDQVHFREPGFEHKGTIATESRAAVAGGITSFMEMPNTSPQTVTTEALLDKRARAAASSAANYAFYLGATNDNLEAIKSVDAALTCGVKVFMGASTGNMLVDNPRTLEAIFASTPLLVATHCEDTPTIIANERRAREQWGDEIPFREHATIRSAEACWLSSSLAVDLARRHGTRLHVLHLTTAREMALFAAGPVTDKQITAEACVHHLFFTDADYERLGADIKCNPAIKSAEDRNALLAAVANDVIDVIATDHAPHTIEEKAHHYPSAPSGLPLVQHALLSLFDRVADGTFSVTTVVNKTSHAPAQRFGVAERGFLREGYFADLVVIGEPRFGHPGVLSKCGWSPFAGHTFSHEVHHTWVNGAHVYAGGRLTGETRAQPLVFDRPWMR